MTWFVADAVNPGEGCCSRFNPTDGLSSFWRESDEELVILVVFTGSVR